MKLYSFKLSKRKSLNSISVNHLLNGNLSLQESLYISMLKEPGVRVEVSYATTGKRFFEGEYEELREYLKISPIREANSRGIVEEYYLSPEPPVKG